MNQPPPSEHPALYQVLQMLKQRDFDDAQTALQKMLDDTSLSDEARAMALSTMGVLHRLKGDNRESFKHYRAAESILSDDPALKIIVAGLLIDEFKQYDQAAKKLGKVLQTCEDLVLHHKALALYVMCLVHLGQRERVKTHFDELCAFDFSALKFTSNVDFKVVELLMSKHMLREECLLYLDRALQLASSTKDAIYQKLIQSLKNAIMQHGDVE